MAVYSYETGERLEGLASATLREASAEAGDTGAVAACLDNDGVWQHVGEDRAADERARGRQVVTVYVI